MVIDTFGGNLAVIAYKTEKGTESDEMCFIDPEGDVRIFSTTEECVRFLEQKAKSPSGKFGFMTRSLRQQAALA